MSENIHEIEKDKSETYVYHNPDIQHTYYLLIPSATDSDYTVLLQKNEDETWALPSFEPMEHHFAVVQHINDIIKEKWGLSTATLRCFATQSEPEKGEIRFYALDNIGTDVVLPDNLQWVDEKAIRERPFANNLQRDVTLDWFDWRHSDNSSRASWMRTGWYPKISHWMIDLADRMSLTEIEAPTQVRSWARSATMKIKTKEETLYLKAVPHFFSYEPVITRVLSIRYPERAPDVRAVHVENGWMLMREFEGTPLTHIDDIEVWKRAVKEFARLQIDLIKNTQSLVALGVPDRNVDYLASQITRLMQDLPNSLTEDEKIQLQRFAPTLRGMCHELAEYNIPLTLTHGDLWSGQVIVKADGKCLFFDWSDASISHPFFDMTTFLAEVDAELPTIPDARSQLITTYLQNWGRYEPMANLKQAYSLAMILGSLHQALFYYVHILPGVESAVRWELSGMLTHLLRQVIHEMKSFKE